MSWYQISAEGLRLKIQAQPGAKRTESAGLHGDCIRLRLASPPVDGKANECLIGFVAERLGVKRNQVRIAHGQKARRKTVLVLPPYADPALLLAPGRG